MASNTTPPSSDNVSSLYLSDTFYTWFNTTNDLITKVNPIEVYSITADGSSASDGITLSADGNGNWTVGYALPQTITTGYSHTFLDDIIFAAGVCGNIVNTFNGNTGDITGVETVSGYVPTAAGNVESAVFSINGVTAGTAGGMTLTASSIPDTLASITGPAGYIITSGGGAGGTMNSTVMLFQGASPPGITQTSFRINSATEQVVIGGTTFDSSYRMKINHGNSGGIFLSGDPTKSNDIYMGGAGAVKSDANLIFACGGDTNDHITFGGGTAGSTAQAADIKFMVTPHAEHDVRTVTDGIARYGKDFGGIKGTTHLRFYTDGDFKFRTGDKNSVPGDSLFQITKDGAIGVNKSGATADFGVVGQVLSSGGEAGPAYWTDQASGGGGGDNGAVVKMFSISKRWKEEDTVLAGNNDYLITNVFDEYDIPPSATHLIISSKSHVGAGHNGNSDSTEVSYNVGSIYDANTARVLSYVRQDIDGGGGDNNIAGDSSTVQHIVPIPSNGTANIRVSGYSGDGYAADWADVRVEGYIISSTGDGFFSSFDKVVDWGVEAGPMVNSESGNSVYNTNGSITSPNRNAAVGPAFIVGDCHIINPVDPDGPPGFEGEARQIFVRKHGTGTDGWILAANVNNHNVTDLGDDRVQISAIIPAGYEWYAVEIIDWRSCTWSSATSEISIESNFEYHSDYREWFAYQDSLSYYIEITRPSFGRENGKFLLTFGIENSKWVSPQNRVIALSSTTLPPLNWQSVGADLSSRLGRSSDGLNGILEVDLSSHTGPIYLWYYAGTATDDNIYFDGYYIWQ